MEKSFFISGIGGQGIQLLGKAFAYAANECDLNLCLYPYYAGQRRGGVTYARLTIAEGRIGAPEKEYYDFVALMDEYSYENFKDYSKRGGVLLLNSDLIKEEPTEDVLILKQPFTKLSEAMGPRTFNLILAGYISETVKIVPNDLFMEEILKLTARNDETRKLYTDAFNKGVSLAKG